MALISGEGKACISCHTSLPYALVEPLLVDEHRAYRDLIENIDSRILAWSTNTPWYSDKKLEQTAVLSNLPPDALKGVLNQDFHFDPGTATVYTHAARIPRLSALNPAHQLRRQAPKPVRPLTDVDGTG